MGQNSSQEKMNYAFKKEDAYQSLDIINTWINNVDTKVSFALALVGVLIGIILGEGSPNAFQNIVETSKTVEINVVDIGKAICVCLLYLCSFLSAICFIWAIVARVKMKNNDSSIYFFNSISRMELLHYKKVVNRISEEQIIEDLEEQIYINSKICSQKVQWYNRGIIFLMLAIVTWFICTIFRLL